MAATHLNKEMFVQMIQEEKPVLVDFWAPWCGYCRRIDPAYEGIAQEWQAQVVVAKVNIDEEPQLAEAEHIEVVPTLVLYHKGKAISSIVAPESRSRITRFLQEALEK